MRKKDNYKGKLDFWQEQYDLAQQGLSKYTLVRCMESLQEFRKRAGLDPMTGEAVTSEAPLLHQQTIKQLLRSMDEDAQAIADFAKDDGTYISAKAVRILVGNIQEAVMHIEEKIGS